MINLVIAVVIGFYCLAVVLNAGRIFRNILAYKNRLTSYYIAWILMFYGIAMFFYREGRVTGLGSMDASSWYQVICIGGGSLIALTLMLKNSTYTQISRYPIFFLFIYGFLGILSGVYSPAPGVSVYKGVLVLVDVALLATGFQLLRNIGDIRSLFNLVYTMVSFLTLGSLVGAFVQPEHAFRYLGSSGVFGFVFEGTIPYMNANELGFLGGVTAIVGYRRMFEQDTKRWKLFWMAQFSVGIVVLGLAQARTTIATFMLSILILGYVIPKLRNYAIAAIPIILLVVIYTLISGGSFSSAGSTATEYLQRGQDEGGLQSLKGRYEAWTTLGYEMIAESPLLGHGFDAGTRYGGVDESALDDAHMHMHNSHFQILSNSGFLGYIAWLPVMMFVILGMFRILIRRCMPARDADDRFHAEITVVAMMIFLRTFTGSVVVIHSWTMMIIVAIVIYLMNFKLYREVKPAIKEAAIESVETTEKYPSVRLR